jgi:hypothetical protein
MSVARRHGSNARRQTSHRTHHKKGRQGTVDQNVAEHAAAQLLLHGAT